MSDTLPVTTESTEGQPIEALAIADQLATSLAATMAPRETKGVTTVLAPAGYSLHDITDKIEKAQPYRNRKTGTTALLSLDSFITYVDEQERADEGYIYANPERLTITAVFNDYRDLPGWRDHRATYEAAYTPEFKRWAEHNRKAMSQTEFAEFIEDNLADLTGNEGRSLLEVATTIQAKTDINFSSAKRLDNGQVQLGYTEVIDAKAGSDGALNIPREFTLGLRIFKNGDGYAIKARLKYRLHSGTVKFWYELDRPERAVEDAFQGYIEQVKERTTYTVLIGIA